MSTFEEEDGLDGEVEGDYLGVAVEGGVVDRAVEGRHQFNHIALVDEGAKLSAERHFVFG